MSMLVEYAFELEDETHYVIADLIADYVAEQFDEESVYAKSTAPSHTNNFLNQFLPEYVEVYGENMKRERFRFRNRAKKPYIVVDDEDAFNELVDLLEDFDWSQMRRRENIKRENVDPEKQGQRRSKAANGEDVSKTVNEVEDYEPPTDKEEGKDSPEKETKKAQPVIQRDNLPYDESPFEKIELELHSTDLMLLRFIAYRDAKTIEEVIEDTIRNHYSEFYKGSDIHHE